MNFQRDVETQTRRRRAEKSVFSGYMVDFGASRGTWSGGGVGRGGVSKIWRAKTSVSRFSGVLSPMVPREARTIILQN